MDYPTRRLTAAELAVIGRRLAQLRLATGFKSQNALAKEARIQQTTVSGIEAGEHQAQIPTIQAIFRAMRIAEQPGIAFVFYGQPLEMRVHPVQDDLNAMAGNSA